MISPEVVPLLLAIVATLYVGVAVCFAADGFYAVMAAYLALSAAMLGFALAL